MTTKLEDFQNNIVSTGYMSVSWGTMRDEDLINAFLPVLENIDPDKYAAVISNGRDNLTAIAAGDLDSHDMDVLAWYMEDLFNAMDELSPDGYYFGASEGDGSDYGYWQPPNYDWSEEG